jgi:hypothetical protein
MLIDFNPRFYNHMAFEVDRGLPLPWIAYLGATGDRTRIAEGVAQARMAHTKRRAYVSRIPMELLLRMQALSGGMRAKERERWREWMDGHGAEVTDPSTWRGDPGPAIAALALELLGFARHPRAFVRHLGQLP